MKLKLLSMFIFYGVLQSAALAATFHPDYKHETHHLAPQKFNHFEIIGAPSIANLEAGNSQIGVTSSETDTLHQTNTNQWDTYGGQLGLGYIFYTKNGREYSDHLKWFTAFEPEVNAYYLSSNSIKGEVYRFNSAGFDDLRFDIPVHSTRLMLDAALTVATYKKYSLYAIAGIGNAWTRLSYSDSANAGLPCPEERLNLNSHTTSQFAWEVGTGVTYDYSERVAISLEYLYVDLGRVRTGATGTAGAIPAPILTPARLSLKSNTALLGLHIAL